MYQGTRLKRGGRRRNRMSKTAVLFIAILLLISAAIGSTVAYLITRTESVENTFTPGEVSCEVTEKFENNRKENVQIKNTGNTDAYIRATYVVNWLDKGGNIVASVPAEYSYALDENPDGKWRKIGDYFYYPSPVAPNGSTADSLLTCTVTHPENPEYTLSVEILATAVQSNPASAVTEAWGVTVSNGQISPN